MIWLAEMIYDAIVVSLTIGAVILGLNFLLWGYDKWNGKR